MGTPIRNLPLNALRSFDAAARHLSFVAAAAELGVTAAAISVQVRRLEEWVGAPLDHPVGYGPQARPTPHGVVHRDGTLAFAGSRLRHDLPADQRDANLCFEVRGAAPRELHEALSAPAGADRGCGPARGFRARRRRCRSALRRWGLPGAALRADRARDGIPGVRSGARRALFRRSGADRPRTAAAR